MQKRALEFRRRVLPEIYPDIATFAQVRGFCRVMRCMSFLDCVGRCYLP